jgi:hypothetical protein
MRRNSTNELCYSAAEKSVFSPEAKNMAAEVWKEVLAVLEKKVPEVKEIVS